MIPALHFIWNPTEGIDLGFFMIRYYSLMFVLAFGLGWYIMKRIFEFENEPIEKLDALFIWTVLATLLGARLGHVFFYDWEYFREHPLEILLPFKFSPQFEFTGFRGLASHGAALSILIAMYFFSKRIMKRSFLWLLDRVVIPVACGSIFVRIGNFFNSEIVGKPTNHPLGIKFIRDTLTPSEATNMTGIANSNSAYDAIVNDAQFAQIIEQVPARHAAQLYEAVGYLLVFGLLMLLYWRTNLRHYRGFIFGTFLVSLWLIRFIVEFVKESQGGFESTLGLFSTGQWLSIPFILAGIYLMVNADKPLNR